VSVKEIAVFVKTGRTLASLGLSDKNFLEIMDLLMTGF
jgi:hypothetical protein